MKKITVIAPANSIITEKDKNLVNYGIEKLKEIGYEIKFQKNIFCNNFYEYSASIKEKIEDISLIDEDTDVILCATGGINSNSILEHLDENFITKKYKNKIIIGNSNNTILLNYFSSICQCKCYLGPNLKSLGKYDSKLAIRNFSEKINNNNLNVIFENEIEIYRNGIVKGTTFGGNGSSLRRIAGTKYFPTFKNKIMILEFNSKENSPIEVDSILAQYSQMGIFDSISGLILGQYDNEISIIELIKPYIKNTNYPVLISNDFGHNCDSTFVPIGRKIYIDTYNQLLREEE